MTYKFVTHEEVKSFYNAIAQQTVGHLGSSKIINAAADLRDCAERIIDERDAALQKIKELEDCLKRIERYR